MPTFTNTFGGTNVYSANVSYRAIALSANVTLTWPTEVATSTDVVASIMDVTPSAGSLTIRMPDASQASVGETALFFNVGSFSFTVANNSGGTIQTLAPGEAWQVYLIDNSTVNGTWRTIEYGAGTSSPSASALAGAGLKAITTTLNQAAPTTLLSADYTLTSVDRARVLVWNGGAGTFTMPSAAAAGNDWFFDARNSGSGGLTIAPSGGELVNGQASLVFNPGDSARILTDGANFYTIGYGQSATFAFDYVSISLTGQPSPYTLSGTNLNRIAYQFSGVLTANMQIIVPNTLQQYWVRNTTTGSYTLTVKTAAGTGVSVVQNGAAIMYCDGTNVVEADTNNLSTPVSIAQGGTGATTAGAALVNLGGTSLGIGVFTAVNPATARAALGAAASGANADITSLSALTTPLSVVQGGTGQSTFTNGQLLIGNTTGNTLTKAALTAGTGITVTNGTGSITIAGTGPDTFPGVGIAYSTGTAWGTSYGTSGTGTTLALTASPAFTGTPTAPTASAGTSTTQVATTAFVASTAFSSALPGQTGNADKFVTTDGANASWSFVPLTTGVTGTLPVANGGTGATTLTGVVRGNGTAAFTTGTVDLTTEVNGTLPVTNGGTGAATLTANNVLLGNGTSALQAVAPGAAGNILTSNGTTWASTTPAPSGSTLTAVASGSLINGSTVVINDNGTVSAIAARGGAPYAGPEFVFISAAVSGLSSVYYPVNQKVIIAYSDNVNSNQGFAVVATVSGTTISYGTPVRFSTNSTTLPVSTTSVVYDSVNQKIVICYNDFNSSTSVRSVKAVVGTVSGTSISFGAIQTADTSSSGMAVASATYDLNAQKVVLVWGNNNGVVTQARAAVGTVSGTSITFGTLNTFKITATNSPVVTYDASVQRNVVAYGDTANSGFATAVIGTVSGTTISFGTPVVFNSGSSFDLVIIYDPNQQKVVIAYSNQANSNFGTAIVGTSTTTSISFGSAVVFNSNGTSTKSMAYEANLQKVIAVFRPSSGFGSAVIGTVSGSSISFGSATVYNAASTQSMSIAYAANVQDMVISFEDTGNLSYGTGLVFQVSGTNLTASNYIGISNAVYTDGQTATIQIVGSVDDAQSGLTPGLVYYVQTSGALATTSVFPFVTAGTAVATTKIIVKG